MPGYHWRLRQPERNSEMANYWWSQSWRVTGFDSCCSVNLTTEVGRTSVFVAYHLCWMKLASYSALITGGFGCLNSEENSIIEEGNGRQLEALTGRMPAASEMKNSWRKRMIREWKLTMDEGRRLLKRKMVVSVKARPRDCRPLYTSGKHTWACMRGLFTSRNRARICSEVRSIDTVLGH